MVRLFTIILSSLLLTYCSKYPCQRSDRLTLKEAQEDCLALRELILTGHPHNFRDRHDVVVTLDSLYVTLRDDMTSLEFFRVVTQAAASVRCGHTTVSLSECLLKNVFQDGAALPLECRVVHDSIVVLESYVANSLVQRGDVVLSINGKSASKIIEQIKSHLGADGANETHKYYLMNHEFAETYLEMIEDTTDFQIEFGRTKNPSRLQENMAAMSLRDARNIRRAKAVRGSQYRLLETTVDSSFVFATLKIRFFDFYDNLSAFAGPIDSFFQVLEDHDVKSLILDVRGNDGGDPYSAAHLLGYLIGKPFRYYSQQSASFFGDLKALQPVADDCFYGTLYVLSDGGSYSTTGHLLSLLRTHGRGVFIGEETGGSFICNGGFSEHRLEHSGFLVQLPHTPFVAEARGLQPRRGINPDIYVDCSVADLVAHRDPCLDTALALICCDD